ncbi:unnamed protein product [Brachionus calyciflorus]|uniref:non-specific serine/threonine protein kinase n=1 Tax=Brachionus calyciflorus TaxID=104777 RepID=A0A813MST3_9BILA|nr:unnamed protein product [Brachionus calyciflorus]
MPLIKSNSPTVNTSKKTPVPRTKETHEADKHKTKEKSKKEQRKDKKKEMSDHDDSYSDIDDESDLESEMSNDSENEEQEDPKDYCKGGYHPINIGDVFNGRYKVLRKVGWGHFSTVWLCWDTKSLRYAALKVVKSAKHYTETAIDEIKLLRAVRDTDPNDPYRLKTVQLYDDFKISGPNGTHVCMVFEVLGHNLLKLITRSDYTGIPLENVRIIVKQVLEALHYLHTKCKIIHTDLKPENVLMCVDDSSVKAMAEEAQNWLKHGIKPSITAVSNAPNKKEQSKMSKNKKKKLKKKEKLNQLKAEAVKNEEVKTQKMSLEDQNTSFEENLLNKSANLMDIESPNMLMSEKISVIKSLEEQYLSKNKENSPANGNDQSPKKCETEIEIKPDVIAQVPLKKDPHKDVMTETEFQVKLADLGNACWTNHHFTEDIQTRQYRSLEVIVGASYDTSADIWSLACMAFELATGDYLFEPHSGDYYSRDEDHLAHVIELLGQIPKHIALSGKFSKEFFNKKGELLHISNLRPWDIFSVLTQKYSWSSEDARNFADFLTPMLAYDTKKRATALECLNHPWISTSIPNRTRQNENKSRDNEKNSENKD